MASPPAMPPTLGGSSSPEPRGSATPCKSGRSPELCAGPPSLPWPRREPRRISPIHRSAPRPRGRGTCRGAARRGSRIAGPAIVVGMDVPQGLRDIESRADCERLVRAFYGRALEDPIIGFIFVDVAKLDLEAHVPRITSFWETILLGAQSYGGGAFRPHAQLHGKVRSAPRPLRAVAGALARHGRRAVRRRPRRAGQDACRSGGPRVPRTPRGDAVSRRCGAPRRAA